LTQYRSRSSIVVVTGSPPTASALDETIYYVRHDAIRIRVEIRRLCPPLLQVHNCAAPRIIPSPGKISFVILV
jgi:hypothetical protein